MSLLGFGLESPTATVQKTRKNQLFHTGDGHVSGSNQRQFGSTYQGLMTTPRSLPHFCLSDKQRLEVSDVHIVQGWHARAAAGLFRRICSAAAPGHANLPMAKVTFQLSPLQVWCLLNRCLHTSTSAPRWKLAFLSLCSRLLQKAGKHFKVALQGSSHCVF